MLNVTIDISKSLKVENNPLHQLVVFVPGIIDGRVKVCIHNKDLPVLVCGLANL